MYGVPQGEYEHLSVSNKNEASTCYSPDHDSMDYGEKLTANHNMLKDLLQIVDSKIANKKSIKTSQVPKNPKEKETISSKVTEKVEMQSNKLSEKMLAVREKLKDIITFINSDVEQKNEKKVVQ